MKKLLLSISIISSFAGAIRAQMPLTAGHQWTKAFPSVNIGIQTEQVTSKETNNGYIISATNFRYSVDAYQILQILLQYWRAIPITIMA